MPQWQGEQRATTYSGSGQQIPPCKTLTLPGSAKATIANSIANSNPLRSDMIGILPRGDYPIFSGGPARDFCSLPLSDHSGPRNFCTSGPQRRAVIAPFERVDSNSRKLSIL